MFRCVFCHSPNVSFDDVVTIEIGHLAVGFNPDFVFGIDSQDVESGDV